MQFRPWFLVNVLAGLAVAAPLAVQAAPVAATPAAKAAPAKTAPATSVKPAAMATTPAAAAKPAPAKATPATPAKAAELVDLNTATREELVKLPGIGDAIAAKIVAGRPFKAKSELLARGLVNRAEYAKLAPYVIAKQAAPAAAKK